MISVLTWYLILTLVGLAAAPLALRLFTGLPARGLLLARPLGVLVVGYLFWLLWSVGLLPNDAGGAWAALALTAALSFAALRWAPERSARWQPRWSRHETGALLAAELLFIIAFAGWAFVRAHDPAASHTEQPMDLMYMSSLWASPSWPPQDAWLSGYPIAYYYFGYWLLVAMGRLAGTPPEITYNVGQAAWFGLLVSGSFGLVWMLLRLPRRGIRLGGWATTAGALLAAVAVAAAGNVQFLLEWLYAQGVNVTRLARWAQVRNFTEGAAQSHLWYIGNDWWWWRTSRVLADAGSAGGPQEVISEFPAFSYVLGDNHPHVLGMPIVLVVLGLALVWFWRGRRGAAIAPDAGTDSGVVGAPPTVSLHEEPAGLRASWLLLLISTLAVGSLLAMNTWDFPAYWALLTLAVYAGAQGSSARRIRSAAGAGAMMAGGALLLMLPWLLTAQSQAGGVTLNFFNPTRLPQFLWVNLAGLLGVATLVALAWRERAPHAPVLLGTMALTILLPAALLWGAFALASERQAFLASNPLPEGVETLAAVALTRWRTGVWSLLLAGFLLALLAAIWLQHTARGPHGGESLTPFILLLASVGVALLWAPEVLFLRDNFGWRMNTIFKFYYQAWLLLAIAGAWSITHAFASLRDRQTAEPLAALFAAPAAALILAGALFLPAGARAKTGGFDGAATLDATAWLEGPDGQREAALWLRANTPRDAIVAEAAGDSYRSDQNRISTLSGRPTLLGWQGHERQWRGDGYARMAEGREEALQRLYRSARSDELPALLAKWQVDYVVVGPTERRRYEMTPQDEARISAVLPLVFEFGDTRLYAAAAGN